jgi:hypothetical protein
MTDLNLAQARPLGKGTITERGVADLTLGGRFSGYKGRIAGTYRSLLPEDIGSALLSGWASPKIDGELWFLCLDGSSAWLANPRGTVIAGDIPLLNEAATASSKLTGRLIIAGELYAKVEGRRCRVGDLGAAIGGAEKANVDHLYFAAFDILPEDDQVFAYGDRLLRLRKAILGSERLKVAETFDVSAASDVRQLYDDLVASGQAEGLVIRAKDGMIYKVKPSHTIDALIIGFTVKADTPDSVRSILLGLGHPDGTVQVWGACGNLGANDDRKSLFTRLKPLSTSSKFRYSSESGGLYTFIQPEVVAEIKVTDLQSEKSDGGAITSMGLHYAANTGWKPLRLMPGVSPLHPVLTRIREDKTANAVDIRFAQVEEWLARKSETTAPSEMPKSTVLRREVWTKAAKDKVAVRKLVVWKTNKEVSNPLFPAYVVHWTDYSSGRGTPMDREVRLAMDEATAIQIADKMVADNIKKGWEKVVRLAAQGEL